MKSELARWPRRLSTALAVAWTCFLLISSRSNSWDGLVLGGLVSVVLIALTFIGCMAGIGFLAAALMEQDRPAIAWSAGLLALAALPVIITLVTRG